MAVAGEGQRAHGIEQIAIGDLAVCEVRNGLAREEKATQGGQAEFRAAVVVAELLHHKSQPGEEVGVARAEAPLGQTPQPGRGVVQRVALRGGLVRLGMEEQVAILGDEEEDQPVDDAQQLAVVVLVLELPSAEPVAELGVGGVGEEAAAERGDRLLDAVAQLVEHTQSPASEPSATTFPASTPRLSPSTRDWWQSSQSSTKSA